MAPSGTIGGGSTLLQLMSTRRSDKYEGRYAARTKVMRSSAMRDLMSLTARPEVISLAGGLAGHRHLPRKRSSSGINADISRDRRALSLQYGPTEGFDFLKDDIAKVMAAEGVEDRPGPRPDHHRGPAGHRPGDQDLHRPG